MFLVHFINTIESSLKLTKFRLGQVLVFTFWSITACKIYLKSYDPGSGKGRDLVLGQRWWGVFLHCSAFMKKITVYMAKIFLERFAVKRIEKITVRLKSLTFNRCEFNENWWATGQVQGEGGPLIPIAAPAVGWVFAKTTGNTCFWF